MNLENTIIAGNTIGTLSPTDTATSDIDIHLSLVVNTTGVNVIGIRDGGPGFFPPRRARATPTPTATSSAISAVPSMPSSGLSPTTADPP